MKNSKKPHYLYLLSILALFQYCNETGKAGPGSEVADSGMDSTVESYYTEADFASVKKFNSHVHISVFDSVFIKQAAADNFRFLTVNVNSSFMPVEQQQEVAL